MNPAELRADIPALDDVVYLNTGAASPSPTRVVNASERFLEHHEFDSPGQKGMYPAASTQFEETRATVAAHIGANPTDIALTQSTADGVNRVASAIDWEEGDVVLRTDVEHPAGILPWNRWRDLAGIEVRVTESENGRLDLDDYKAQVQDARLVCLSAISWTHGTHFPVSELVDIAHDAGAKVLVDAVQAPGQTRMDVLEWGADFVAAAGHKWLLAPWGAGFLYVSPDAADALEPVHIGYMSVEEPTADAYEFKSGAQRLEIGTTSPAPYAGLVEAIETIESVGLPTIESRIEELTDRFKASLPDDRLRSPRQYESGLVSFDVEEPESFVAHAKDEGVVVRDLPTGAVRASFHAFNDESDVDALLELV